MFEVFNSCISHASSGNEEFGKLWIVHEKLDLLWVALGETPVLFELRVLRVIFLDLLRANA